MPSTLETELFQLGRPANPNRSEIIGPDEVSHWGIAAAQPGNSEPPHNSTLHLGWNSDGDGNPQTEGEPVLRDTWEANLLDNSYRYMRRSWRYLSGDGLTTRTPVLVTIDRSDHRVFIDIAGTTRVNGVDLSAKLAELEARIASLENP